MRKHLHKILGIAILIGGAYMAWEPGPRTSEVTSIQSDFQFERIPLESTKYSSKDPVVLPFAKLLQPFAAYISAFVPVGVSVGDINGDGTNNEICYADPFRGKLQIYDVERNAVNLKQDLSSLSVANYKHPTGCLIGDYNEDGRPDLLVYYWGGAPRLYEKFADGSENWRVIELEPDTKWFTSSAAVGDLDGDGHLDLVFANYYREGSKILDPEAEDVEMNESLGHARNGALTVMLKGNPDRDVRFEAPVKGLIKGEALDWSIAVGIADLNGDHLPEVYIANDHGPDRFYYNESSPGAIKFRLFEGGSRSLANPPSKMLGKDAFHGMGMDFGDYNKDGLLDFFVSNISVYHVLHENHFLWINKGDEKPDAPFVDHAEDWGVARSGWAWDVKSADFNNDGQIEWVQSLGFLRGEVSRVPELHETALVNDFFLRYPKLWHKYSTNDEIAGSDPLAFFAKSDGLYKNFGEFLDLEQGGVSRGLATGDFNGDGAIDFVVANQRSHANLFMNQSNTKAFVAFDVRLQYNTARESELDILPGRQKGTHPGRVATGAKVIRVKDGVHQEIQVVDGGTGFGGKKDPFVHFGLGDIGSTELIDFEVHWVSHQGNAIKQKISVKPGWHTIQLGLHEEMAEVSQ